MASVKLKLMQTYSKRAMRNVDTEENEIKEIIVQTACSIHLSQYECYFLSVSIDQHV